MKTKFYGFAIATLMAGALASCSNDVKEPAIDIQPGEDLTVSLVHAPDFYAWSGKQILGDTRSAGTRAEGEEEKVELQDCGCPVGCEMCENFCTEDESWCECQKIHHNDEVEVNLSILDSKNYANVDLASKLSIHVRKATDIKVIMPVPSKYLCESDDLVIFEKHEEGFYQYGGVKPENLINNDQLVSKVEYSFGDKKVTLNFEIVSEGERDNVKYPDGYIRVTTEGIDQDVLDYCWQNNHDGINFEVWTYFQTEYKDWNDPDEPSGVIATPEEPLTREILKEWLDKSNIKFENQLPSYYINAFKNQVEEGTEPMEKDCEVGLNVAHNGKYVNYFEGPHMNASELNRIYVLQGINPDDAHTDHSVVVEESVEE